MDRVLILLISIFGLWLFITYAGKSKDKSDDSTKKEDKGTTTVSGEDAEISAILEKIGVSSNSVTIA